MRTRGLFQPVSVKACMASGGLLLFCWLDWRPNVGTQGFFRDALWSELLRCRIDFLRELRRRFAPISRDLPQVIRTGGSSVGELRAPRAIADICQKAHTHSAAESSNSLDRSQAVCSRKIG